MTVLLFFGHLRDIAGCAQMTCDLPEDVDNVAALRQWLAHSDPELGAAICKRGVRVAVNKSFCISDAASTVGAEEIAFMAPLSGG